MIELVYIYINIALGYLQYVDKLFFKIESNKNRLKDFENKIYFMKFIDISPIPLNNYLTNICSQYSKNKTIFDICM